MKDSLDNYVIDKATAAGKVWDAIIIGAGVGGSTMAYALTRRGLDVLLVEKGLARTGVSGQSHLNVEVEDPSDRLANGRWPTKLTTVVDGNASDIWAPLGCGLGGSSLLYSAALCRLEPMDFDKQEVPKGEIEWPFNYWDLEPYYEMAENLYSVSGTPDPLTQQRRHDLHTPPPISEIDQHFFDSFRDNGLNPYRLHLGIKYRTDCVGCGGHVCNSSCKQDAAESCLLPAASTGHLFILDRTEVVSINADRCSVNEVVAVRDDDSFSLRSLVYVLSAGAYCSPVILQKSRNSAWPDGLGNDFDQVGRNLMFHISEHIGLWPRGRFSSGGVRNTVALRDFYYYEGLKFGEFQSTGISAGYGNVLYYLRTEFDQSKLRYIPLLRHLLRIPAYIASKILSEASVFACILEDFPYSENRVVWDPQCASGARIEYTIHQELKYRIKRFRKILRKTVSSNYMFPMTEGVWLNYGHPCGTCVSGLDPSTSIVDKDCKLHDVDNLYVVDSSFMPTSGGANPSLTIAANALRVADKIVNK